MKDEEELEANPDELEAGLDEVLDDELDLDIEEDDDLLDDPSEFGMDEEEN